MFNNKNIKQIWLKNIVISSKYDDDC